MNGTALMDALHSSDFVNDDGHLISMFASGSIAFSTTTNMRIGATHSLDAVMQMMTVFPARTQFGSSSDDFAYMPLADPPGFPSFLASSSCCTDPGAVYTRCCPLGCDINHRLSNITGWYANVSLVAGGVSAAQCLLCPPGTWAPINAPNCFACAASQWCGLGTPALVLLHGSAKNCL